MADIKKQTFVDNLRLAAKSILLESNKLKEIVVQHKNNNSSSSYDEEGPLGEVTRSTGQAVLNLVNIVRSYILESQENQLTVEQNYLLECCKHVKDSVVSYIESAKGCAANPLDFLSTSRLGNAGQEVVASLKELLNAAESDSAPPVPEIRVNDEEPQQLQLSAEIIAEDVRKTNVALNLLSNSVETVDVERFKLAGKAFLIAMTRLMDIATEMELGVVEKMKEISVSTVQTGRVVVSQTEEDQSLKDQWAKAKKIASLTIQQFVLATSKSHVMKNSFVDSILPHSRSSENLSNTAAEEENNAKIEIGIQILTVLQVMNDKTIQSIERTDKELGTLIRDMLETFKKILEHPVDFSHPTALEKPQIKKELLQLMNQRSMKEWQLATQEFQGSQRISDVLERRDHTAIKTMKISSESNTLEGEMAQCSNAIGLHTVDFLNRISEGVLRLSKPGSLVTDKKDPRLENIMKELIGTIKVVLDLSKAWIEGRTSVRQLKKRITKVELSTTGPGVVENEIDTKLYQAVDKILSQTREKMIDLAPRGQAHQTIINVTNEALANTIESYHHIKLDLEEGLKRRIFNESHSTRLTAADIMRSLNALIKEHGSKQYQTVLGLCALCRTMTKKITSIADAYETLNFLEKSRVLHTSSARNMLKDGMHDSIDIDDINVWEDKSKIQFTTTGDFLGGTLNQLIVHLTTVQDTTFVSTFVTTYQSFTSPWTFLQKIIQRYNGPPPTPVTANKSSKKSSKTETTDPNAMLRIKLRVCVVLKYWIDKQFEDFDAALVEKLSSFINETIKKDSHKDMVVMGNRLMSELEEKIKQRHSRKIIMDPLPEFTITENKSPIQLFMEFNESEIARQLTLIEFQIFKNIKPSELLNQAWNKPKLQHTSPNVMNLIGRANKMSFWVASVIVWHRKLSDRVKVIDKFIRIAQFLRLLNNFNTLISIIAGLNISAVSRLKHTWAQISPISQNLLPQLQELFDPSNSYKHYRGARKEATSKGPVMPYIGVPLSDLTFSEDGNPDILDRPEDKKKGAPKYQYINFAKREIICKIISDIQLNQQDNYPFPKVDSIYNCFIDCPFVEEKELYDLSLICEPRNSDVSQVEQ